MRSPCRWTPILVVLALAGLVVSCFEPPVAERMLLAFAPDGSATATLMIDLARAEDFESPAAQRRIAATERELMEGSADWLARFEGLTSGDDGLSWRRTAGALREFRRWAAVDDPVVFGAVFADDPVAYSFSRNGEVATLEIAATGGSRATRKERERVEREVAAWSDAFARYVGTVIDLESYLAGHPERRRSCWQRVFDVKPDAEPELLPGEAEPAPAEEALTGRLNNSLGELLAAFKIDRTEAFSLDERVRKLFHPLSAQLVITLPVAAAEVEGFEAGEPSDGGDAADSEHPYAFPERSLLAALDLLEERWLAIGPLRARFDYLRGSADAPMEISQFVEAPVTQESATPPGATEVADLLLELLRPAGAYRLVWRVPEMEAQTR